MSGYPGLHSTLCRFSTARRCCGCGEFYVTPGHTPGWCITCGRDPDNLLTKGAMG